MQTMPRLISFPFRIDATGAVATVEQNSDPEVEEQLAVAMLTRPGERIVVPTFGVLDPAFDGFLVGALQRHCLDFGPDVTVRRVDTRVIDEFRQQDTVQWSRVDETSEVAGL
jgi:hypothetical protein